MARVTIAWSRLVVTTRRNSNEVRSVRAALRRPVYGQNVLIRIIELTHHRDERMTHCVEIPPRRLMCRLVRFPRPSPRLR